MSINWVCEVGSAHKGSESLAYEFIRKFSESGARTLKFQLGWSEEVERELGLLPNPIRYAPNDWVENLNEWCEWFGVEFMASIWSIEGLELARSVGMKRYKIAHQVESPELIAAILSDGKETFESRTAYEDFDVGYDNLVPVLVSPRYPTYPNELHLPKDFMGYGYSDHTHGIEACLLAVSRNAKYIEKHVCFDKSDLTVRDTPFSATPEEFRQMVNLGNGIERLLR